MEKEQPIRKALMYGAIALTAIVFILITVGESLPQEIVIGAVIAMILIVGLASLYVLERRLIVGKKR